NYIKKAVGKKDELKEQLRTKQKAAAESHVNRINTMRELLGKEPLVKEVEKADGGLVLKDYKKWASIPSLDSIIEKSEKALEQKLFEQAYLSFATESEKELYRDTVVRKGVFDDMLKLRSIGMTNKLPIEQTSLYNGFLPIEKSSLFTGNLPKNENSFLSKGRVKDLLDMVEYPIFEMSETVVKPEEMNQPNTEFREYVAERIQRDRLDNIDKSVKQVDKEPSHIKDYKQLVGTDLKYGRVNGKMTITDSANGSLADHVAEQVKNKSKLIKNSDDSLNKAAGNVRWQRVTDRDGKSSIYATNLAESGESVKEYFDRRSAGLEYTGPKEKEEDTRLWAIDTAKEAQERTREFKRYAYPGDVKNRDFVFDILHPEAATDRLEAGVYEKKEFAELAKNLSLYQNVELQSKKAQRNIPGEMVHVSDTRERDALINKIKEVQDLAISTKDSRLREIRKSQVISLSNQLAELGFKQKKEFRAEYQPSEFLKSGSMMSSNSEYVTEKENKLKEDKEFIRRLMPGAIDPITDPNLIGIKAGSDFQEWRMAYDRAKLVIDYLVKSGKDDKTHLAYEQLDLTGRLLKETAEGTDRQNLRQLMTRARQNNKNLAGDAMEARLGHKLTKEQEERIIKSARLSLVSDKFLKVQQQIGQSGTNNVEKKEFYARGLNSESWYPDPTRAWYTKLFSSVGDSQMDVLNDYLPFVGSFHRGGFVKNTGKAILEQGELVIPRSFADGGVVVENASGGYSSSSMSINTDAFEEAINKALQQFKELKLSVEEKLQPVEEKLQPVEVKLQPVEEKLQPVEVKLQPVEEKLQPVEEKLQPVEVKLQPVEVKLQPVEEKLQPVEEKLQPVEVKLQPVEEKLQPVEEKLQPVEVKLQPVEDKLQPVEEKLQPVEEKLQPVEVKLQPVEEKLQPVEEKLQPVEVKLQPVEEKLQPVEVKLQPVEEKLQPVEVKLQPVEEKLQPVEEKLQPVEEKLQPVEKTSPIQIDGSIATV
ncbi:hypothetical protein, partial [Methanoculleus sp.]|uniref:hypothetical protein n=1 Tax=Methanoculleus sp. TaxID=90427 RepID=UPI0025CC72E1